MNDMYQQLNSKYLQSYCLCPSSLAAAETESSQNEIYRIITVNNEYSEKLVDWDNSRYAIKKEYKMTLKEFMEWLPSAGRIGDEIISIEKVAISESSDGIVRL